MIDHISLGSIRFSEAVDFYRIVLSACDMELLRRLDHEAAFGTPERWAFFLNRIDAGMPATAVGTHIAFGAASRAQVQQVYDAALAAGASSLFTPRERPDISPTYFGATFCDLDGHRIEVLTNAN